MRDKVKIQEEGQKLGVIKADDAKETQSPTAFPAGPYLMFLFSVYLNISFF